MPVCGLGRRSRPASHCDLPASTGDNRGSILLCGAAIDSKACTAAIIEPVSGNGCCERLAFLDDERYEGFDGHTAFVDSFVYSTWLDKNGFTRLENFRRLAFLFNSKFTFEYVTYECAGVPMSAFATTNGDGDFHEHHLITWNR